MKCWICGNEGKTGEHKTKASDLRNIFGNVTQQTPVYLHTDQKRNLKVGSIKSDRFKSSSLICAHCNNARTASHDRAWERLSRFLRDKKPNIKTGDVFLLEQVFPGEVKTSMLNVHLFFIKLFGCYIVEYDIPIYIDHFSEAIMNQKPHPNVYISFWPSLDMGTGNTNMDTENINGKCVFATWFYIVDPLAVNIMYAEPTEQRRGLLHAWHPSTISNSIYINGSNT